MWLVANKTLCSRQRAGVGPRAVVAPGQSPRSAVKGDASKFFQSLAGFGSAESRGGSLSVWEMHSARRSGCIYLGRRVAGP